MTSETKFEMNSKKFLGWKSFVRGNILRDKRFHLISTQLCASRKKSVRDVKSIIWGSNPLKVKQSLILSLCPFVIELS